MNTPAPLAQPDTLDSLRTELQGLDAQPKNAELLTASMRLHQRLVASLSESEGPEFDRAVELSAEIQAFTQAIVDTMLSGKLAVRRDRRRALRDNNERAGRGLGAGRQGPHGHREPSFRVRQQDSLSA